MSNKSDRTNRNVLRTIAAATVAGVLALGAVGTASADGWRDHRDGYRTHQVERHGHRHWRKSHRRHAREVHVTKHVIHETVVRHEPVVHRERVVYVEPRPAERVVYAQPRYEYDYAPSNLRGAASRLDRRVSVSGLVGAATGGILGSRVGGGNGRLATTAAGTLVGYLIGEDLARY